MGNLILLCPTHHRVSDDLDEYPARRLKIMKAHHEARFAGQPYDASDAAVTTSLRRLSPERDRNLDIGIFRLLHTIEPTSDIWPRRAPFAFDVSCRSRPHAYSVTLLPSDGGDLPNQWIEDVEEKSHNILDAVIVISADGASNFQWEREVRGAIHTGNSVLRLWSGRSSRHRDFDAKPTYPFRDIKMQLVFVIFDGFGKMTLISESELRAIDPWSFEAAPHDAGRSYFDASVRIDLREHSSWAKRIEAFESGKLRD